MLESMSFREIVRPEPTLAAIKYDERTRQRKSVTLYN